MKPFGGGVPDQYYSITSRLSARGRQQVSMRLVASSILMLGLPAALAAPNPRASVWSEGSLAFLVIALGTIVMATPWLRYRWPSREVSTAVVIIGSLVLTVGCSQAADPFAGLLISTGFTFILGYAALFHGARVQAFVAAASALTVLTLMVRIAAQDIPTAIAVTVPVVMVNVVAALGGRIVAGLISDGGARTDVEPLTGLLTRDGFDEMVATLLGARNRGDDRYLVIVVATIDTYAPMQSLQDSRATDRIRIGVGQTLRETVRRDALIAHVDDAEFLVADTFTTPDPTPLAERILGAVAAIPQGITASIGVVCTPLRPLADRPPEEVIEEVVASATAAMDRARSRGGNQADYDIHDAGR